HSAASPTSKRHPLSAHFSGHSRSSLPTFSRWQETSADSENPVRWTRISADGSTLPPEWTLRERSSRHESPLMPKSRDRSKRQCLAREGLSPSLPLRMLNTLPPWRRETPPRPKNYSWTPLWRIRLQFRTIFGRLGRL